MIKVMTVVGTRPELIKLSAVIGELDMCSHHVLVHTGQNFDFELNEIFFKDLGIRKPDHFLGCAGGSPMETVGQVLTGIDELIERENPDAALIYGDTNSCLAVMAFKRRKVPVFHMEAGNRCFDQRVPEELNRKVVDHLSDVNFPLTEHARRYLLAEGLSGEMTVKSGSCMDEVITKQRLNIEKSQVLKNLNLEKKKYFVVSAHREENVDSPEKLSALINDLNQLVYHFGYPILFSTHPRTRKRLEALKNVHPNEKITFSKPLGFTDYVRLQMESYCVLSDSGTLSEEAAILGFPAVHLRECTERPEALEHGIFVLHAIGSGELVNNVKSMVTQRGSGPWECPVADYKIQNVAKTVAGTILSYTGLVNRKVWRKPQTSLEASSKKKAA